MVNALSNAGVDGRAGPPFRLLHDDDHQRKHLGQNRDAFEQEQRKVDRAGNLRRRARLTSNRLRGTRRQPSDAQTRSHNSQAESDSGAHVRNCETFHSSVVVTLVRG